MGSRSHKILPSSIHIMWPKHLRALKLLCPMVQEKMHLQKNTLFDLDPKVKGQGHMNCCLVPSTSCDPCTGKIWSCYFQKFMRRCVYKKIHYLTFDLDLGIKATKNVTQYPWHYVTYAQAIFEVATSKSLWEDAFTRKYIIWPLTLTLGSRSHEMSPSTLYIMWSMHLQSLKLLRPTV